MAHVRRSLSEASLFFQSWHYSDCNLLGALTEDPLSPRYDLEAELVAQAKAQLNANRATKAPKSSASEDPSDLETPQLGRIHPRKNAELRDKYKEITYTTGSEGRQIIEAATLDQLVRAFAEETQDMVSIQRMILSHGQVIDSELLFKKFVDYFQQRADNQVVQFRVINFFKKWIEMSYASFQEAALGELLKGFMDTLLNSAPQLGVYLDKAISMSKNAQPEVIGIAPVPTKPKKKKDDSYELMDFAPDEIARQLTLIDWELSSKVPLKEMLRARWIKNQAPHLESTSSRVNDLAYWFAWQIVTTPSMKKRVTVMVQIIKIAKHLMTMNSYNSLMAVYLACNFASTARLTQSWKNVPAKHFQLYQKLCSLMTPRNNFKNYRDEIQKSYAPMVLCQEVFLKDLLYQEDGKDDYIIDNVIDVAKLDEIGRVLDHFHQSQAKQYPFHKVDIVYQFLHSIPTNINVEMLDAESQKIEPGSINFNVGTTNSDSLRGRNRAGSVGDHHSSGTGIQLPLIGPMTSTIGTAQPSREPPSLSVPTTKRRPTSFAAGKQKERM